LPKEFQWSANGMLSFDAHLWTLELLILPAAGQFDQGSFFWSMNAPLKNLDFMVMWFPMPISTPKYIFLQL